MAYLKKFYSDYTLFYHAAYTLNSLKNASRVRELLKKSYKIRQRKNWDTSLRQEINDHHFCRIAIVFCVFEDRGAFEESDSSARKARIFITPSRVTPASPEFILERAFKGFCYRKNKCRINVTSMCQIGPNGMPPHAQDLHKNDPHSAGKPSTAHPSEKKKQPLLSTTYIKIKGVWKIHRTTQVSDPEFTHSTRQPILLKGKSALPPNHWWRKSYSEFLTQQLNGSCKRKQTVRCFLCFLFFFLF